MLGRSVNLQAFPQDISPTIQSRLYMESSSNISTVIEAGHIERRYWQDIWRYRELLYFLAWRDVLVRYRQTSIGVAWALIRPLLTMIVFSIIFGRVAQMPSAGVPYPLLVLSAMLPWQFFSNSLSEAGVSLLLNSGLISKVYFPRILIAASTLVVSFVDFAISFLILFVLMAWYHVAPSFRLTFLPLFTLISMVASLGLGLLIAALNVRFRDFRFIIPFLIQLGLYASPVGFSSSAITNHWRMLYSVNPMVGAIDGFRWSITGAEPMYWPGLAISTLTSMLLLWIGITYFRRTERSFADII